MTYINDIPNTQNVYTVGAQRTTSFMAPPRWEKVDGKECWNSDYGKVAAYQNFGQNPDGSPKIYLLTEHGMAYYNCDEGLARAEREKREFEQLPSHLKYVALDDINQMYAPQNLSQFRPSTYQLASPDLNTITYANKVNSYGEPAKLTLEQAQAIARVTRDCNFAAYSHYDQNMTLAQFMGHSSMRGNTQDAWIQTFQSYQALAQEPVLSKREWRDIIDNHNITLGEIQKGISISLEHNNQFGQTTKTQINDLRGIHYDAKSKSISIATPDHVFTGHNCYKTAPSRMEKAKNLFPMFKGKEAYSNGPSYDAIHLTRSYEISRGGRGER